MVKKKVTIYTMLAYPIYFQWHLGKVGDNHYTKCSVSDSKYLLKTRELGTRVLLCIKTESGAMSVRNERIHDERVSLIYYTNPGQKQ